MTAFAATPRPSATTRAMRVQPSTTWRAVIQTPVSATEKAVPVPGFCTPGTSTTTAGSKGEEGPRGMASSPARGGGGGGASACSRRPIDAMIRAVTMAR